SGSPTGCARIKALLVDLDTPQQQVTLEAKVVAINKTKTKDLGIDWSWDVTPQYAEYEAPQVNIANGVTTFEAGKVTRANNKGIIQFGRNPEGHPYEFYYQAKINALISNGNAKILASPKLTTINGKEARILIGDRIPVLTEKIEDGKTTTTVEYVDAGIKLIYTPTITEDGTVTAKVQTEVSTPTLVSDIKNYRITTREAETTVCMKDGETMVIGGLIGSEESKTNNNIPFLSNLPLIGTLFKSVHNSKAETEVIIFLTAKVAK
ncbi:MAG: type and secretion system protein, partial [Pelosinus sp.]|nr:type and secretion system protein [Pelosinus sp.]